jgi:hypothetical protein
MAEPIPGTVRPIDLTGCFFPARPSGRIGIPDQPCYMEMPDVPNTVFLPIFSDVDDLKKAMELIGIEEYKIKHVDDGKEFTESVLGTGICRIMLNPRRTERGTTRWTEVILD